MRSSHSSGSMSAHRPLSRVVHGPRVTIDPFDIPIRISPLQQIAPGVYRSPLRAELSTPVLPSNAHPPYPIIKTSSASLLGKTSLPGSDLHDSCYSSCCSDSEHSSLSRNTSAASETPDSAALSSLSIRELEFLDSADYKRLLDFAMKLGFHEHQLLAVLQKLGSFPPAPDRVLAELTALGPQPLPPNHPPSASPTHDLRPITIDGSNIAITHGLKEVFSCLGIRECVNYFKLRGHTDIKVFVPQFRKEAPRPDSPITDLHILLELEKEGVLVWTPSRRVAGRRIVCHDDRYILKTAVEKDAVIVSNDNFRELMKENAEFRRVVEERLLMYSFVDGKFMPPDDPLGRHGPSLDQFLSKSGGAPSTAPQCPYGRKCTYGNKCKFFHPERPGGVHISVTEKLKGKKAQLEPTSSLNLNMPTSQQRYVKTPAFRTHSLNPEAAMFRHKSPSPDSLHPPPTLHSSLAKQRSNPEPPFKHTEEPSHFPSCLPWLRVQEEHPGLYRNMSAPTESYHQPETAQLLIQSTIRENNSSLLEPNDSALGEEKGSVSDSQLHLVKEEDEGVETNFFVPSSAVWGPMEYSVSPVTPAGPWGLEPERSKLHYHLSSLFPQEVVSTVMRLHPQQTDPQLLCSLILQFQHNPTTFN